MLRRALVGGGLARHVVLCLQAIHRNHELQVRQRGPRQWDRTERAGHNLNVGAPDQLRQQDLEFPVTDERVASNNRHMERAMSIHHFEHACDQFLSLEIRQAAQVRGPEMSVLVRVHPGQCSRHSFVISMESDGTRPRRVRPQACRTGLILSAPIVFPVRCPLRVEAAWKLSVVGEPRKNAKTVHSTTDEQGFRNRWCPLGWLSGHSIEVAFLAITLCNRKHGPYLIRRLSQVVGVSRSFSQTRFPLPQNPQERGIEDSSAGLHTDNQTRSMYDIILRDSEA
jgi:hypothetical protein